MYCTYVRLCTVISGQEVGIMLIDSRSSCSAFYPNEVPRILQRHQMKAKTNVSKTKSRRGFTLVEMLVVIGMIAALAGISFPVYRSIQKKVEKQQVEMMYTSSSVRWIILRRSIIICHTRELLIHCDDDCILGRR